MSRFFKLFCCMIIVGCVSSDAGVSPSDSGNCVGFALRVPYDCPTIQEAVDQALGEPLDAPPPFTTVIMVADGVYNENLVVHERTSVMILAENSGEAQIHGDTIESSVITIGRETSLTLYGLKVLDSQMHDGPHFETIVADGSAMIYFDSVGITTSGGTCLWANSIRSLTIENSTFAGDITAESGNYGIVLLQDEDSETAHIYRNMFQNLRGGIQACAGTAPLRGYNESGNANSYMQVGRPYYYVDVCH